jgi:predicted CopG family antitoxin
MPSRNVAIRKDVYDALDRERRPGESFTRLFIRLLHQRGPLEELLGSWGERGPSKESSHLARLRGGNAGGRRS